MAAPRPSVSPEVFLDAALAIVDEFGADALTTRSLGNAVGLDSTTVYRYFGSKDVLLGTLFDYVTGKVIAEAGSDIESPRERLVALSVAYQKVFFEHPSAARLNGHMADMIHAGRGNAPNTMALSGYVVGALLEMGLAGRDLAIAYQMVESFIVGAVMLESEAHAHTMAVRVLRYRAFGAGTSGLDSLTVDDAEAMSDETLRRGIDAVLDAVEAMASSGPSPQ